MRTIFVLIIIISIGVSSCRTVESVNKTEMDVAGYTLKCKKELLQQEILKKKTKKVYTNP